MKLWFCMVAAAASVASCVGSSAKPGGDGGAEATVAASSADESDIEWLQTAFQAQLHGGDAAEAAARAALLRAVNAPSVGGIETWQGGGLTGSVETLIVDGQCLFMKQEVANVAGEPDWGEPTWGWACANDDGVWFQCGIGPGISDPGSGPECGDP